MLKLMATRALNLVLASLNNDGLDLGNSVTCRLRVRCGATPRRSVPHWAQVVTGASITVVGFSTNGRSAFVCPGFAPRGLRRFPAGRFCFQSRDGGCDELRDVVGGLFSRSTSACNWRIVSACCNTNSISSSATGRAYFQKGHSRHFSPSHQGSCDDRQDNTRRPCLTIVINPLLQGGLTLVMVQSHTSKR